MEGLQRSSASVSQRRMAVSAMHTRGRRVALKALLLVATLLLLSARGANAWGWNGCVDESSCNNRGHCDGEGRCVCDDGIFGFQCHWPKCDWCITGSYTAVNALYSVAFLSLTCLALFQLWRTYSASRSLSFNLPVVVYCSCAVSCLVHGVRYAITEYRIVRGLNFTAAARVFYFIGWVVPAVVLLCVYCYIMMTWTTLLNSRSRKAAGGAHTSRRNKRLYMAYMCLVAVMISIRRGSMLWWDIFDETKFDVNDRENASPPAFVEATFVLYRILINIVLGIVTVANIVYGVRLIYLVRNSNAKRSGTVVLQIVLLLVVTSACVLFIMVAGAVVEVKSADGESNEYLHLGSAYNLMLNLVYADELLFYGTLMFVFRKVKGNGASGRSRSGSMDASLAEDSRMMESDEADEAAAVKAYFDAADYIAMREKPARYTTEQLWSYVYSFDPDMLSGTSASMALVLREHLRDVSNVNAVVTTKVMRRVLKLKDPLSAASPRNSALGSVVSSTTSMSSLSATAELDVDWEEMRGFADNKPLQLACRIGHFGLAYALVLLGATAATEDSGVANILQEGVTMSPLYIAIGFARSIDIVKLLVEECRVGVESLAFRKARGIAIDEHTSDTFPDIYCYLLLHEDVFQEQRTGVAYELMPGAADHQMSTRELDMSSIGLRNLAPFKQPFLRMRAALQRLILSKNQINVIPPFIGRLVALQELDLTGNPCAAVPEAYRSKSGFLTYAQLLVEDNLYRTGHAHMNSESSVHWNSVRVMVVGDGSVGKSSLVDALLNKRNVSDGKTELTESIDIHNVRWNNVSVQLWDFAGQRMYMPTHQLFLTPRTIYVVVFNICDNDFLVTVEYWLKQIKLKTGLGVRCPVMLVGTHFDQFVAMFQSTAPRSPMLGRRSSKETSRRDSDGGSGISGSGSGISRSGLTQRRGKSIDTVSFAERQNAVLGPLVVLIEQMRMDVSEVILTSPVTGDNVKYTYDTIRELCMRHPIVQVPVPAGVLGLRAYLESIKTMRPIATMSFFRKCVAEICGIDTENESEMATLIGLLRDVGAVLYFPQRAELTDTIVLSPQWLIGAINRVINFKNHKIKNGMVKNSFVFGKAWSGIESVLQVKLYWLMVEHEIIYPMQQAKSKQSKGKDNGKLDPAADGGSRKRKHSHKKKRRHRLAKDSADDAVADGLAAKAMLRNVQSSVTESFNADGLADSVSEVDIVLEELRAGVSVVPSLLPISRPSSSVLSLFWDANGDESEIISFVRVYRFKWMPIGFFSRVVARFAGSFISAGDKTTNRVLWRYGVGVRLSGSGGASIYIEYDPQAFQVSVLMRRHGTSTDLSGDSSADVGGNAEKSTAHDAHVDEATSDGMALQQVMSMLESVITLYYPKMKFTVQRLVPCPFVKQVHDGSFAAAAVPTAVGDILSELGVGARATPREVERHFLDMQAVVVGATGGDGFVACKTCGNRVEVEQVAPDVCLHGLPVLSNVNVHQLIGAGGFGQVYIGDWNGVSVAIKELAVDKDDEAGQFIEFQQEAITMSVLDHPNILKLFGCVRKPRFGMVLEYMPLGDLRGMLKQPDYNVVTVPWRKRLRIMLDIAKGMAYLHAQTPPLTHRDLRSPNCFIRSLDDDADVCAVVADFGTAQAIVGGNVAELLATWQWLPPELFDPNSSGYDHTVDIYSFGIVLWEVCFGEVPFAEHNDKYRSKHGQVNMQAIKNDVVSKDVKLRPTFELTRKRSWRFPESRAAGGCGGGDGEEEEDASYTLERLPSGVSRLATACWHHKPSKRPPFSTIVDRLEAIMNRVAPQSDFVAPAVMRVRSIAGESDDGSDVASLRSSSPAVRIATPTMLSTSSPEADADGATGLESRADNDNVDTEGSDADTPPALVDELAAVVRNPDDSDDGGDGNGGGSAVVVTPVARVPADDGTPAKPSRAPPSKLRTTAP